MPLVCKTHGNAIVGKRPQLLDESIVEFLGPFSSQEGDNLWSSVHKFGAISPSRVRRVGERDFLRITGIPSVFSEPNLLNRSFAGERRHGWTGRNRSSGHSSSLLCSRFRCSECTVSWGEFRENTARKAIIRHLSSSRQVSLPRRRFPIDILSDAQGERSARL